MPDPRAWLMAVGSCDWPGENGDEDDLPAANPPGKKLQLLSYTFLRVLKKPCDQSQVMLEGLIPARVPEHINKHTQTT